jgi:hypothetical protein
MARKIMDHIFYRGIASLKNIGVSLELTKEQIQEYIKCSEDPIYFIKNYVKIISLDHGLIPFKLYDYQVEFINAMHENRRVISMQPRQSGKTQVVAAYIMWYTLFNDEKTVAILAHKASAAREIMSRYQKMYENLPMWLQEGVKSWNKGSIELENGSKAFIAATTANAITGRAVNFLYIDETAVIPNTVADDFFTSAYPTLSSGKNTKIVLTSTPRGYNHFWVFWSNAHKEGDEWNEFVPIRVNYYDHPSRDEAWAAEQLRLLGQLKFNQEILCDFIGSSSTLVDGQVIAKMVPTSPVYTEDHFDVLEPPKEGHIYTMVVDTSKGVGNDYSAFTIIDVTEEPYTLVAKYRNNNIDPKDYPFHIHKAAKYYNNAYILIEINASEQVASILHEDYEYENILFVSREKHGQVVTQGFGGARLQYGVNTDKKVKRIGCLNLKYLIEKNKLLITDFDVISELSTFIEHKGSYAADEGYNDDLVMTLVLFGWLTTNDFFKQLTDVKLRARLSEFREKAYEDSIVPIGGRFDGTEYYDKKNQGFVEFGDYWTPVENG